MELQRLSSVFPAVLLILVLSWCQQLQLTSAEHAYQCKCSNTSCLQYHNPNNECCIWDFPDASAPHGGGANQLQSGFALGLTTREIPRLCITYPIAIDEVNMKNYFLVLLDLEGAGVCISEMDKPENKSCSVALQSLPVLKADYCSGVSVSGVQSVKFSLDCVDCENSRAVIQFRVYSESFNTTQEHWCDQVDKSVPSEVQSASYTRPPILKPTPRPTLETDTTDDDHNGAPRSAAFLAHLSILFAVLSALLVAH